VQGEVGSCGNRSALAEASWDAMARLRLLPLQVEITLQAGNTERAPVINEVRQKVPAPWPLQQMRRNRTR
jgi:hypothetical protein